MDYKKYYSENASFKSYVDKYCVKTECDVDTALTHKLVQAAAEYYKDAIKDKITEDGIVVGCGGADAPSGECR